MQGQTLVCYDGVCGLCNRLIRFLLARDRRKQLWFAPLQGRTARTVLTAHGYNPADLDTVYVIADWGSATERVYARSAAVLHALGQLDGGWRLLGQVGAVVPRPLADIAYRLVARSRYRFFGRLDACPLPRPGWTDRFVDR